MGWVGGSSYSKQRSGKVLAVPSSKSSNRNTPWEAIKIMQARADGWWLGSGLEQGKQ